MKLSGIPAVSGLEFGDALLYIPYDYTRENWQADRLESLDEKIAAYRRARDEARAELERIAAGSESGERLDIEILNAHIALLDDVAIDEDILSAIADGSSVSKAIIDTYESYIALLCASGVELTQARSADIRDIRSRLLRCLAGKRANSLSALPGPRVVVAKELMPSDTATIDRENLLAIVTEEGGLTSHTVIIARSYGIPTVVGATGITDCVADKDSMIVDAQEGLVYIRPLREEIELCAAKKERLDARKSIEDSYLSLEARTLDGERIAAELNISSAARIGGQARFSDGAGLMRSEFLYLERQCLPGEDEQFNSYCEALKRFEGKPVILRTMDIGGDKQLECMKLPAEQNPFLGNRALRLCLSHPELFKTQLRAALRASAFGDLWLMFPMVGSLEDWRRARDETRGVMRELEAEGAPFNPRLKLGVMIEIPSIAVMADKIAREADFASVGTNDLCQYLMAADRMNPEVADYYQMYNPAVFRLLRAVVRAFADNGKPLGVCGEMGSDPRSVLALLGLGVRMFSMSAASLAQFKYIVNNTALAQTEQLANEICEMDTAREVEERLRRELETVTARAEKRGD